MLYIRATQKAGSFGSTFCVGDQYVVFGYYRQKVEHSAPIKRLMSRGNTSPVIKSLTFLQCNSITSPPGFAFAPVVSLYSIVTKQLLPVLPRTMHPSGSRLIEYTSLCAPGTCSCPRKPSVPYQCPLVLSQISWLYTSNSWLMA